MQKSRIATAVLAITIVMASLGVGGGVASAQGPYAGEVVRQGTHRGQCNDHLRQLRRVVAARGWLEKEGADATDPRVQDMNDRGSKAIQGLLVDGCFPILYPMPARQAVRK